MTSHSEPVSCRSCGHKPLTPILSLGRMPLANALLATDQLTKSEEKFPLDLVFCSQCTLVQITETVPAEKLFSEYLYFSSFSDTMLDHARRLAEKVRRERSLNEQSLVVEIASNDGYLLRNYQEAGVPVLGIEPAQNIARFANEERRIPTMCDFFGVALADRLAAEGKRADIIHAHNVLAHIADLNGAVRGIARLLKDSGVAIIEVPYVKDMIDERQFDTIYHEHLCYFSLTALNNLFRRHHLMMQDVERLSIHGGTLRTYVTKAGSPSAPAATETPAELLREEAEWGVRDKTFYLGFGEKVEELRSELSKLLKELKLQGKRIAAYGASAKGSTLLNYLRIGAETLDFVVDRSRFKQGHLTPGNHLHIFPPEKLLEDKPDYVLLLTWNFADEILAQQAEYGRRGGRFIIPIPELRVV